MKYVRYLSSSSLTNGETHVTNSQLSVRVKSLFLRLLPLYHERRWRSDASQRPLAPLGSCTPLSTSCRYRRRKKGIRNPSSLTTSNTTHVSLNYSSRKRCWKIIQRSATAKKLSDRAFCNILAPRVSNPRPRIFFLFVGSFICSDNDRVVN